MHADSIYKVLVSAEIGRNRNSLMSQMATSEARAVDVEMDLDVNLAVN
jgi:hypothetical protein